MNRPALSGYPGWTHPRGWSRVGPSGGKALEKAAGESGIAKRIALEGSFEPMRNAPKLTRVLSP